MVQNWDNDKDQNQAERSILHPLVIGRCNMPKQLAEQHWSYVESVLKSHGESAEIMEKCGFHYKTAFLHGYKHAIEVKNDIRC
jgi:pantothenate kinase